MDDRTIRHMMDNFNIQQTDELLQLAQPRAGASTGRRVLKKTRVKCGFKRGKRRMLIPVAACLCALLLTLAIFPPTAEAIANFFRSFSVSSYMGQPEQQRTKLPDVEKVINRPTTDGYKVYVGEALAPYLDENSTLEGMDPNWRNDEKYQWLNEVRPEVREVLYDGNNLVVTGCLYTQRPAAFYSIFVYLEGEENHISFLDADLQYGGEAITGNVQIQLDEKAYSYDEDGAQVGNMEYISQQDYVPFYAEFHLQQPLPDGVQDARISLVINDHDVHDMQRSGMVARVEMDVTVDGAMGNATKQDIGVEQAQTLTGEAIIPCNNASGVHENKRMDVDGYTITLHRLEQTQTGLLGYFSEVHPAQLPFTGENGLAWHWKPMFLMVVDGANQGIAHIQGRGDTPESYVLEIPLLPSDIEQAESVELVPLISFTPSSDEERQWGEKQVYEILEDGSERAIYYTAFYNHTFTIK